MAEGKEMEVEQWPLVQARHRAPAGGNPAHVLRAPLRPRDPLRRAAGRHRPQCRPWDATCQRRRGSPRSGLRTGRRIHTVPVLRVDSRAR